MAGRIGSVCQRHVEPRERCVQPVRERGVAGCGASRGHDAPGRSARGQANFQRVVKRAIAEGCGRVVDLSMFADQGSSQFVSTMRVLPLLASTQSVMRRGTNYSLGAETFTKERRDPLTKETLDRLSSSSVAQEFAQAYLAQPAEPGK